VLLHSTKMQKHAPTQEGGAGSHAAVMSLEQNGDEVKYKVKLGRAGAVMMAARSDESDDEELGMTPSRGENEMRTVVEMLSQVRQGLRFRVQVRQGLGFRVQVRQGLGFRVQVRQGRYDNRRPCRV
jgi:hypothetical protein